MRLFNVISRTLVPGRVGGAYPSADMQSVYSTAPTNQVFPPNYVYVYIYIYINWTQVQRSFEPHWLSGRVFT